MQRITVTLNPGAVAFPAQQVAVTAAQVIAVAINSATDANFASPWMTGPGISYRFQSEEKTAAEMREIYKNWLFAKGFQDLARGIRESLEEAYRYIKVFMNDSKRTTMGEFEAELEKIRKRSKTLSFPDLLNYVNRGLTGPLAFGEEFLTLQRARNCFEHRGGVVGKQDIDNAGQVMTLSFPRLKMFYMREGSEIEVLPGEVIDVHENVVEVPILIKRDQRVRTYDLGCRLSFGAEDFHEIAMACHMFAADLAAKLPLLEPSGAASDVVT